MSGEHELGALIEEIITDCYNEDEALGGFLIYLEDAMDRPGPVTLVGVDCLDGPLPGAHRHLPARRRRVPDLTAGRGGAAGIGGRVGAGRRRPSRGG